MNALVNGVSAGINSGFSVLGSLGAVVIFVIIVWKGPGLLKAVGNLIVYGTELLGLKIRAKVLESKESELQELDGSKSKPEPPTFEEWMEWKRSTKS